MSNPFTGEVVLTIDGQPRTCKLTLGALAELEGSLGTERMVDLVARFERETPSARDVMALVVAGLRGGGWDCRAEDLLDSDIEGGPVGAAKAAAALLARAFAVPG